MFVLFSTSYIKVCSVEEMKTIFSCLFILLFLMFIFSTSFLFLVMIISLCTDLTDTKLIFYDFVLQKKNKEALI